MPSYQSSHTGTQIDNAVSNYVTMAQVQNLIAAAKLEIYPIGSIYMSINPTNPGTLFGGTWQQIQDTFLLACGETYTAGNTGGEAEHILTQAETPAHTHTRGTMNITGSQQLPNVYADNSWPKTSSGALSWYKASGWFDNGDNGTCNNVVISLNAANGWTGETSSVGEDQAHNNMPPYIAVYMWKRVA